MADRKPLKVLPDGGGDSTGLGEFVEADTIGVVDGGTGLGSVGANQLLTGNGTSALTSESNLTFDGTSTLEVRGPAANFGVLTLSTAETTIVNTDPLGRLDFKAPLEGSGSNAVLPTARIEARATETFDATHNQTDLLFLLANDGGVTEKMRMLSSGGLTFNGDTAAANALDDYEEGTWSPVVKYDGTGGTAYSTGSSNTATYTKIGRLVYVAMEYEITNPSADNDTSTVILTGLPFTAANVSQWWRVHMTISLYTKASSAGPYGAIGQNNTYVAMYKQMINGTWDGDVKTQEIYQSSGSVWIGISGCYHVA